MYNINCLDKIMEKAYSKKDSQIIENAMIFLMTEYLKSGFNEKPVIFHSLKVACSLAENGSPATTIAAATLHDLLEDSEITIKDLEKKFGKKISNLVSAVSFKTKIKDKKKQYQEMFKRTKNAGKEALMIKCADILDNSNYYRFGNNPEMEKILMQKLEYFIKIAEPKLKNENLFIKLKERQQKLLLEIKKESSH